MGAVEVAAKKASVTPHWSELDDADELADMAEAATRMRELSEQIKPLEEEKKALSLTVQAVMIQRGLKSVRGDTWTVLTMPGRKTIVAEKLVMQGVTLQQIAKATVEGDPFIQVRGRKDESEG